MKRGIIYSLCLAAILTIMPAARAETPSSTTATGATFTQQIINGPSTTETVYVDGHAVQQSPPDLPGEATFIAARLVPADFNTNWRQQRIDLGWNIYSNLMGWGS